MKRKLWIVVIVVLVVLLGIQLIPVSRTNPPVTAALEGPPEVVQILRAACYDCHSHETRWPWYSRVAPVSWLVAGDVREARDEVNFSRWGEMDTQRQLVVATNVVDEVSHDKMPPSLYRLAHPDAHLEKAQVATLEAWVKALGEPPR